MRSKKFIFVTTFVILIISAVLITYAYSKTWGKYDIKITIHMNEQLIQESAFGESPTFAIWLENPETHKIKTVFVTRRAAEKDWEGKAEVPVALPAWFFVSKNEALLQKSEDSKADPDRLIVTGATPKPGYFIKRVSVARESEWILWLEVNLAGDFNEYYQEYNEDTEIADEYLTGQPALIYRTKIKADPGTKIVPEIIGITSPDSSLRRIIRPLKGITTATDIFDEISIEVVKTKPKIISW